MKRLLNIGLVALVALPVILLLLWVFGVFGQFAHEKTVFGGADIMLTVAAIYLVFAIGVLVVMTLLNMGNGRGNSKLGLFVFGGLLIAGIICYFTMASDAVVIGADATKPFDDPFTLKITDTMLYVTYLALGVTVVALLWGVIRKALK